jgi:hypothetical protein
MRFSIKFNSLACTTLRHNHRVNRILPPPPFSLLRSVAASETHEAALLAAAASQQATLRQAAASLQRLSSATFTAAASSTGSLREMRDGHATSTAVLEAAAEADAAALGGVASVLREDLQRLSDPTDPRAADKNSDPADDPVAAVEKPPAAVLPAASKAPGSLKAPPSVHGDENVDTLQQTRRSSLMGTSIAE